MRPFCLVRGAFGHVSRPFGEVRELIGYARGLFGEGGGGNGLIMRGIVGFGGIKNP
jgi:hypothetical protein